MGLWTVTRFALVSIVLLCKVELVYGSDRDSGDSGKAEDKVRRRAPVSDGSGPERGTPSEERVLIRLNIKHSEDTEEYLFERFRNVKTHTAKRGFCFGEVKDPNVVIWSSRSPSRCAVKVTRDKYARQGIKRIVITLINDEKEVYVKRGPDESWVKISGGEEGALDLELRAIILAEKCENKTRLDQIMYIAKKLASFANYFKAKPKEGELEEGINAFEVLFRTFQDLRESDKELIKVEFSDLEQVYASLLCFEKINIYAHKISSLVTDQSFKQQGMELMAACFDMIRYNDEPRALKVIQHFEKFEAMYASLDEKEKNDLVVMKFSFLKHTYDNCKALQNVKKPT